MTSPIEATYDLPQKAKLIVRTEHGGEWEATAKDLEKFGLVRRSDAYLDVQRSLARFGFKAGTDHCSLRYAIERVLYHNDPLDPENDEDAGVVEELRRHFESWVDRDE
jgi:hypothetical protein